MTLRALALLLAAGAAHATQFQVTLPADTAAPVSGRLIVFARPIDPRATQLPDSVDASAYAPRDGVVIAAQEVAAWAPGRTVELDADLTAWPAPFRDVAPGQYAVQVVLDRGHTYAGYGRGAGNLVSRVVAMDLPTGGAIVLAHTLPPAGPWTLPATTPAPILADVAAARPAIHPYTVASPALARFSGQPAAFKGYVVLPPDYDAGNRRYPVAYWFPGFGGPPYNLAMTAVRFQRMMASGAIPPMIWVVTDMSGPTGPNEFTDSVNNGPWGTAFATELVPWLDRSYRTEARAGARFLTGHSSGGWASLHLQLAYPQLFGGTWSTAPDPADFHAFINADLYAPGANVYRGPDGKPLALTRAGPSVAAVDFEESAHIELVLGAYGGQSTAFEWVFSPRGADGRPLALFDRVTGAVDPGVAQYWMAHHDLAAQVGRLAPAQRHALAGKLHLWVGGADSFYLDRAAIRFTAAAKAAGVDAQLTVVPDRDHFTLYTQGDDKLGLYRVIAAQMLEASRAAPARK